MTVRQVIGRRRETTSKQERGVQRRKKLVEATRHFLQTQDPQEISFREIAKHAGVPEGSAYHFFANKYDLFSALAAEMGERFAEEAARPIGDAEVSSWQDFVILLIDQSVSIYRADPIARKVLLGATMPNEVRNTDQKSVLAYAETVRARFDELFEMPKVSKLTQRLIYALTIIDAVFEFHLRTNDNLDDAIVEEANFATIGYLSNFVPPVLERKLKN